ncbi:unnamed protein product [Hymenolepis diminuta]|uniref:Uncharacterized protein n=1 Tax=Hymenolepis diminuta TaxID=6216 RepID=A0A0R3SEC5_HYMDI|nr:unnamed protein product [Hymenolepis diminuta]
MRRKFNVYQQSWPARKRNAKPCWQLRTAFRANLQVCENRTGPWMQLLNTFENNWMKRSRLLIKRTLRFFNTITWQGLSTNSLARSNRPIYPTPRISEIW